MTEENEKLLGKWVLISVVIFFSFHIIKNIYYNESLQSSYSLTKGKVTGYGRGTKISFYLDYTFAVDGREIYGNTSYPLYNSAGKMLIGKTFPVVYSKSNFSNNRMLVVPKDFQKFNIYFPDSLNWVKTLPGYH